MRLFPTELTCLWVPPTSHSQQQSVLQDLTSSCRHLLSRQPLSTASIALISHCWESLGCFTNTLPCSALHTHPCWRQLSSKTQEDKTFLYGFCPYYRQGHCQGSWVSGRPSSCHSLESSINQGCPSYNLSVYTSPQIQDQQTNQSWTLLHISLYTHMSVKAPPSFSFSHKPWANQPRGQPPPRGHLRYLWIPPEPYAGPSLQVGS